MKKKLPWHVVHAPAVGILIGATGAAYFVGVHPIVSEHVEKQRLNATLVTNRKREAVLQRSINASAKALENARLNLEDQIALLPASKINRRVADVVDLAIERDIATESTKPGHPQYGKDFGVINITMEGRARFPDVVRFLNDLNTSQRDFGVRSIEISRNRSDPFDPPSFRLELTWFILKDRMTS